MQGEGERLKGSEARSDSALQTLRERLRELEGEKGGGEAGKMVSEFQTEIGRLKKTLSDKVRPQNQCCKHTHMLSTGGVPAGIAEPTGGQSGRGGGYKAESHQPRRDG